VALYRAFVNFPSTIIYMKMLTKTTELSKLWDCVCLNDQNAYAELHCHLYPGLFIYAKGILKDDDAADDLVQDLFVKLWTKKSSIGKIGNVKGYFYSSLRCMAINYLKSRKNMATNSLMVAPEDMQLSAESLITGKEEEMKLTKIMEAALNRLPSRQREIVYLRFYEDLEYTQIVEVTGVKYQSVINHIYRAMQFLREEFKSYGKRYAA